MENTISMVKFLRISYENNPARCLKEFSLAASFFRVKLLYRTTLSFMNVIIVCFHLTFFGCSFAVRRLYGTMSSAAGTVSWSSLRLCKYSCKRASANFVAILYFTKWQNCRQKYFDYIEVV